MNRVRLTSLFIILLSLVSLVIDIPANIPLKFSVGSIKIDRVVNPPKIDFTLFGKRFRKEFTTQLGLDLQGGTQLTLEAKMDDINESDRDKALDSAREIIERRVNFFGIAEPTIQTSKVDKSYRIIVELPGVSDIDQAIETIGQTAQLELREFTEGTPSALPSYANTIGTDVTGADLKNASLTFHQTTGAPVVEFELTRQGSKKFADLTTRITGRPLAIFLDDVPISWPIVQEPITEGRGVISGNFTRDQAKRLALQLSAGALPTPIEIIEKRTIGATLGEESISKSMQGGVIGLLLVASFMGLYYGYLGILSVLALIIYGLISFAIFRIIPITLTLPGIAGFILSIGMAVDSNILIFERIKEELRKGKDWAIAMEIGFGKAWDSIRDANVTTLLTALILFNPFNFDFLPMSGMVRGFALTLGVGVLVSLFTGIVVTRTLIRVLYKRKSNH